MTTTNDAVAGRGLRRALGPGALILFGLTYLAPVTVFTTYGIVTQQTDNHLPSAYLVALVAMLFTALSYGRMARLYPVSGSAYTYSQQSFGGHVGFLTGWALMLDYLLLPMINFLLIGIYLHGQYPSIPQWIFVLASLVLALACNVLGVTIIHRLSWLVVGVSVLLVLVFAVLAVVHVVRHPDAGRPGFFSPLLPGSGGVGSVFSGAAVLALSFLGFDAVSTMSEESKNPTRDIPRAILWTTLLGGAIFLVVSWIGAFVIPDWHGFADLDNAGVDLMVKVGGSFFSTIFVWVYVVGAFGSGMTTQVSVSRIIFAMGRDGILPRSFGRLHERYRTPYLAALFVSAISLLALVLSLSTAASTISFGALAAFSMVNLAVTRTFFRGGTTGRSTGAWVKGVVLPLIGFGLTVWLWTSLSRHTLTLGLIWLAIGAAYLAVSTGMFRRQPPVLDFSENAVEA